jgi:hypothetical protein
VGGRRVTSIEATLRFVAAVTAARDGKPVLAVRSSRQRDREIERKNRELTDAGLYS